MFFQVRLWKGLTTPYLTAHQLHKAERITGIWKWLAWLLLFTLILSGTSAYFGIGHEQLSKLIYDTSSSEFATIKGLFALGQVLQSLLVTAVFVFLPALILWIFTDSEYFKLVVIQLFVASIYLLEKIIIFPMELYIGLDHASSPFSLGIMAQYITDYQFISNFLSEISLFSVWSVILQYQYLKVISEKNPKQLLLLIISINLFLWLLAALFSYIKFEVLF